MPRPDPTEAAAHGAGTAGHHAHAADPGAAGGHRTHADQAQRRARVITVSDRSAAGLRADLSGPAAAEVLTAAGWQVDAPRVVPDGEEPVRAALEQALTDGADLVLTLGGTGVGPRDRTPEGTRAVLDLEAPGVAEVIRARGLHSTPTAALSRGIAGTAGHSMVVNLPGSPAAVRESLEVLVPLVPHVLDRLRGGDH